MKTRHGVLELAYRPTGLDFGGPAGTFPSRDTKNMSLVLWADEYLYYE
jgi:hypothetical protein